MLGVLCGVAMCASFSCGVCVTAVAVVVRKTKHSTGISVDCDKVRLSVEFVTVGFLGICRHS